MTAFSAIQEGRNRWHVNNFWVQILHLKRLDGKCRFAERGEWKKQSLDVIFMEWCDRPLGTKQARGSSGAAAMATWWHWFAATSLATELYETRSTGLPTPPKKLDDLAPFSIVDSLSHCSDYDVSDLEEGLVIQPPGQANDLPELQQSSALCPTCAPWIRKLSHRLSACEVELDKCPKKIKRVITAVNDAWIDALAVNTMECP